MAHAIGNGVSGRNHTHTHGAPSLRKRVHAVILSASLTSMRSLPGIARLAFTHSSSRALQSSGMRLFHALRTGVRPGIPTVRSFGEVPRSRLVILDIDDTILWRDAVSGALYHTDAAELYRLLHHARWLVIATARGSDAGVQAATLETLRHMGLQPDVTLFTSGAEKGPRLALALAHAGLMYEPGIFIDDNMDQLRSVETHVPHLRLYHFVHSRSRRQHIAADGAVRTATADDSITHQQLPRAGSPHPAYRRAAGLTATHILPNTVMLT